MPLNNKEVDAAAVKEKDFELLTPGNLVQVCALLKATLHQVTSRVTLLTVNDFLFQTLEIRVG